MLYLLVCNIIYLYINYIMKIVIYSYLGKLKRMMDSLVYTTYYTIQFNESINFAQSFLRNSAFCCRSVIISYISDMYVSGI